MPYAPLKPCGHPGCRGRQKEAYCAAHRRDAWLPYDRARGKTAARGYGARHRKWANVILARDPICVICGEAESVIADHVLPVEDGGDWSLENGQGLCRTCHNQKTAGETVARRRGGEGGQIPAAKRAVTGPRSNAFARRLERKRA